MKVCSQIQSWRNLSCVLYKVGKSNFKNSEKTTKFIRKNLFARTSCLALIMNRSMDSFLVLIKKQNERWSKAVKISTRVNPIAPNLHCQGRTGLSSQNKSKSWTKSLSNQFLHSFFISIFLHLLCFYPELSSNCKHILCLHMGKTWCSTSEMLHLIQQSWYTLESIFIIES